MSRPAVEARFHVVAIKQVPMQAYADKEDGTPDYTKSHTILGGHVELAAAKHGTFGKATPMGTCQMTIANPEALKVFKDAFERHVENRGRTPKFRVVFTLDEDQTD